MLGYMECVFPLQGMKGKLFCRADGVRCALHAEAADDGRGLYKVYLRGAGGRLLMGTLAPEQGRLSLKRSMSVSELRRAGCWPLEGGEGELSFSFAAAAREMPEGWERAGRPETLLSDAVLRGSAERLGCVLLLRRQGSFCLAAPYDEKCPFPLEPLFCLGTVRCLAGRPYVVYRFLEDGTPGVPDETAADGRY